MRCPDFGKGEVDLIFFSILELWFHSSSSGDSDLENDGVLPSCLLAFLLSFKQKCSSFMTTLGKEWYGMIMN